MVTPDEVGDPHNLKVTVVVNGQVKYQGSTSEISHKSEDVFAWLGFIAPLKPGSVMGIGTIPDCTGCDHDDFIDPGADIASASHVSGRCGVGSRNRRKNCYRVVGRCGQLYQNTMTDRST